MRQIDPQIADTFKIRCSAISEIMAGVTLDNGLTSNQRVELDDLLAKQAAGFKSLTIKQLERLNELTTKFNAKPELPEGAKTYCKKWLKRSAEMYNRRTDASTKQTEKGLIVEDDAIDFIADALNFGFLLKNEQPAFNDYMTGCCDIKVPSQSLIIDNKSSWSHDTFPILESKIPDKDYELQGQGYMELYDMNHFWLVYTLMDTPVNIIERECKSYCYRMGYGEMTEDIFKEFVANMTYSNLPKELRIKVWKIERDRSLPPKIEARVKMCREYIKTLISELNSDISGLESF